MARGKKNDGFELAWQGLVVIPGLGGFALGFNTTHSLMSSCLFAGLGAGLGIGIISMYRIAQGEKLKRSGISEVDRMTGKQFEHYLGHLFKSQGYSVQVTRESGDFGADLVLQKDGKRIVVQAKRYKQNVGIKAVQEAQASIAHYKAHQAWVVTNSNFTEAAITLAKSNGVRLIGRNELVELMLQINTGIKPQTVQKTSLSRSGNSSEMNCDKCGKRMTLRKSSQSGEMAYVCVGFPLCRTIKRVSG